MYRVLFGWHRTALNQRHHQSREQVRLHSRAGISEFIDPVYMSQKLRIFLSNFLLLSENYETLAHEIDPAEPEEDTDSVK